MAEEIATLEAPPAPTADWRASLPEELRAEKSLESFKDVGALAKSWVSAQKLIGEKVPEGLTPESVREYLSRKTEEAPESPDKYSVRPPVFPEDMDVPPWDMQRHQTMMGVMHSLGLSNKAAQTLVDAYAQLLRDDDTARRIQRAADHEATYRRLEREWGSAFKDRVGNAKAFAARRFADRPDILAMLESNKKVGNDPNIIELFAELAEDAIERGDHIRGDDYRAGRTADEIAAEIERIRNDPKSTNDMTAGDRILTLTRELLAVRDRSK